MQPQQQNPARSSVTLASCFRGQHRVSVVHCTVHGSVHHVVHDGGRLGALSTLSSGARASALLLQSCAVGLRALGLYNYAQLLHNSPLSRSLSSLRALAKSLPGSGFGLQTLRSAASARRKAPGGFEAALPRPTGGLFARVPSLMTQAASRSRCALRKHRIGRVWGRSLRYRSLGLAIASAVTGSVSAGALPSPCFAWELRITALRPWGACANLRSFERSFFALAPSLAATARNVCAGERVNVLAMHEVHRGCGRSPYQKPNLDQTRSSRGWSWFKRLRSTIKARPKQFKARPNA